MKPQNLYTASEAMNVLGMTQGQFQNLVRQGRLKHVIPPGRTRGMYLKKEVDELTLALNLFSSQLAGEEIQIRQTTPNDLEEEWRLASELFGNTTTAIEKRRMWLKESPDIMLSILINSEIMGYLKIGPLKKDTLDKLMRHEMTNSELTTKDFDAYSTKHPINLYIFGIGVRRGLSRTDSGYCASRLMSKAASILCEKGEQGVEIQGMYTTSYTPYGQSICERLGFKTLEWTKGKTKSYELLIADSNAYIVRPYKKSFASKQCDDKPESEQPKKQRSSKSVKTKSNNEKNAQLLPR